MKNPAKALEKFKQRFHEDLPFPNIYKFLMEKGIDENIAEDAQEFLYDYEGTIMDTLKEMKIEPLSEILEDLAFELQKPIDRIEKLTSWMDNYL